MLQITRRSASSCNSLTGTIADACADARTLRDMLRGCVTLLLAFALSSAIQGCLVSFVLLTHTRAHGVEGQQRQRRLQLIEQLGIAFTQLRQLVLLPSFTLSGASPLAWGVAHTRTSWARGNQALFPPIAIACVSVVFRLGRRVVTDLNEFDSLSDASRTNKLNQSLP